MDPSWLSPQCLQKWCRIWPRQHRPRELRNTFGGSGVGISPSTIRFALWNDTFLWAMTMLIFFVFSYNGHPLKVDSCCSPQLQHLTCLSHCLWALSPQIIHRVSLLQASFVWPNLKQLKHCRTWGTFGRTLRLTPWEKMPRSLTWLHLKVIIL